MVWKKGESGNKSGLSARDLRWKRMLEDLTKPAIQALADSLQSDNPQVKLAAAKEVLDRTMGKPKQQATLDVTVTATHAAHLSALNELATAKLGPIVDLDLSEEPNEIKMIAGGET